MSARTKARKRALDILFESEQRGLPLGATLAERQAVADPPVNPYTVALVEGVIAHQVEIDEIVSSFSVGWPLERMPAVDRAALRIAVFEIRYGDEVPSAVAIDEAIELVKTLSTEESAGFVNGVLGQVVREVRDPLA